MSPGLARSGIRGAWFSGSSTLLTSAIQAVKLVILARLLATEDFGVSAMAMVVISCATLVSDLGISGAVIQRDEVPPPVLARLYGLSLGFGAALFLAVAALAPLFALAYREPRVAPVIAALATVFLALPVGSMHQALAEKRLAFKRVAAIEVAASLSGAVLAVAAALAGAGVFALVTDQVASAAVKASLLVIQGRSASPLRPAFSLRGLRPYLRFGGFSVGQRTANFATANIDYALVGSVLGAHPLGLYRMAYELATLTGARLNVVVSRVFFPVLSRLASDRDRFRRAYLRMQETATLLGAPCVVGIALVAPLAVPGLLGERWSGAVPLLRVLCIVGLGRVVAGTIGPALLAAGRPDMGLRWSLALVAMQVPAIALAVFTGGLPAVAWTFAVLQTLYVVLNYRLLVRALFGPCLGDYLRSIVPALAMSAVMAGVVLAMLVATGRLGWAWRLGLAVTAGAAAYVALVVVLRRPLVEELAMLPQEGATR